MAQVHDRHPQVRHGRLMRGARIGLGLLALALMAGAGRAQTPPAERSLMDSVYTPEQAARGDTTFQAVCARCHTVSQFQGAKFMAAWEGGTAYQLFDQIRGEMPQDNPGSLSQEQYLNVTAYLFRLNGFPAGSSALPAETAALKKIRIPSQPESK
jgi:mono/diheme cytochrome c family protein